MGLLISRYHWSRDRQRLFDYSFQEFLWRLRKGSAYAKAQPWLEDEALQPQLDRVTIDGAIGGFRGQIRKPSKRFRQICSFCASSHRPLQHVFKTNHAHYARILRR
mgnify:CR=1 FL=1